MTLLSLLENFGCDVIGRATQSCPSYGLHIAAGNEQSSQSKVANLGVHSVVEEDVTHLQISVNDALSMHVLDGSGDLHRVESNLGLRQPLALLDHVHKRTIGAELENKIHAVMKRERSEELDNVLLVHLRVDLEFGLELQGALDLSLEMKIIRQWG